MKRVCHAGLSWAQLDCVAWPFADTAFRAKAMHSRLLAGRWRWRALRCSTITNPAAESNPLSPPVVQVMPQRITISGRNLLHIFSLVRLHGCAAGRVVGSAAQRTFVQRCFPWKLTSALSA
eukprot:5447725-Prymnesium_polylepis.1